MIERMTTKCERCGKASPDLIYCEEAGEYWCEACWDEALDNVIKGNSDD